MRGKNLHKSDSFGVFICYDWLRVIGYVSCCEAFRTYHSLKQFSKAQQLSRPSVHGIIAKLMGKEWAIIQLIVWHLLTQISGTISAKHWTVVGRPPTRHIYHRDSKIWSQFFQIKMAQFYYFRPIFQSFSFSHIQIQH